MQILHQASVNRLRISEENRVISSVANYLNLGKVAVWYLKISNYSFPFPDFAILISQNGTGREISFPNGNGMGREIVL